MDDFFRHITDLTAHEEISLTRLRQEKPYTKPELSGERVRDSYLILRHSNNGQTEIIEYRTDGKGDNFDQVVVHNGFLVTSGFALSCNYFSTGFQSESTFRYLGRRKNRPREILCRRLRPAARESNALDQDERAKRNGGARVGAGYRVDRQERLPDRAHAHRPARAAKGDWTQPADNGNYVRQGSTRRRRERPCGCPVASRRTSSSPPTMATSMSSSS